MSEENEELNLDDSEEVVNLNITGEQKIDVLADGTEILRDELIEEEEVEEEISDENLIKLLLFTTGEKNPSEKRLASLREDEVELERLIRVSMAKSSHLKYAPKKKFHASYKKERQRKNRQVKKSRTINR